MERSFSSEGFSFTLFASVEIDDLVSSSVISSVSPVFHRGDPDARGVAEHVYDP